MSAVSICVSLRCVGWADKSEDGEGQAPVQALQKPGLCLGRLPGNVWTSSRALLLWGFYHSHSPFHPLVTPVEFLSPNLLGLRNNHSGNQRGASGAFGGGQGGVSVSQSAMDWTASETGHSDPSPQSVFCSNRTAERSVSFVFPSWCGQFRRCSIPHSLTQPKDYSRLAVFLSW